ncbi:MAG: hypothetical protein A2Z04_01325 [Chloroflexi bacterium RBG_16_57_9]|nr:MAG: hypothetical protein A2Z04_01325 [Chloroflexi bacterium RBG_16_57_9]
MKLTILGASPACPNAGGACSGYLVESGGTYLLLDCGPGVLSRLQLHVHYRAVSAVVISHIHADHILDLIPFAEGLKYGPYIGPARRIPVYMPPGGAQFLADLARPLGTTPDFFGSVFDLQDYDPAQPLTVGSLRIGFSAVNHYIPTWAIRVSIDGRALVYSADTGPSDALASFAHGAELLLIEATLPDRAVTPDMWGHLSAAEAGQIAHAAGVKRLVLTHIWQEFDRQQLLQAARSTFSGPVETAHEGLLYQL